MKRFMYWKGSGKIILGVGGSLGYMKKESCLVIYKGMEVMIVYIIIDI